MFDHLHDAGLVPGCLFVLVFDWWVCSFCGCVVVCPLFISSLMILLFWVLINSVVSFVR